MAHPKEEGQRQTHHKGESQEVVGVFAERGERRKGVLADHWKQDVASIKHVQPGDRQNDEGSGHKPVGEPVYGAKAQDCLTRRAGINLDAAANHVKQPQHENNDEKPKSADRRDRPISQGPPVVAFRLDHDGCKFVFHLSAAGIARAHVAPQVGVRVQAK